MTGQPCDTGHPPVLTRWPWLEPPSLLPTSMTNCLTACLDCGQDTERQILTRGSQEGQELAGEGTKWQMDVLAGWGSGWEFRKHTDQYLFSWAFRKHAQVLWDPETDSQQQTLSLIQEKLESKKGIKLSTALYFVFIQPCVRNKTREALLAKKVFVRQEKELLWRNVRI